MRRAIQVLTIGFLALLVIPTPCVSRQNKNNSAPAQQCLLDDEDYAVYSAVLLDRGKPEDPEERWDDKPDLIISEVTDSGEDGKTKGWGFRSASSQAPSEDTVEHFNSRRNSSCQLKNQLKSTTAYHFLSRKEEDVFFKKKGPGGWKDFYRKYPKSSGYWTFSPVGYDSGGAEALVYVGHHCGGLCGTGHLVLLTKEDGRWVIKNRLMLWIS